MDRLFSNHFSTNYHLLFIGSFIKISHQQFLKKLSKRTKSHIDDYLLSSQFPLYISRLVPYVFLLWLVEFWIIDSPYVTTVVLSLLNIYGVIVTVWILRSILQTIRAFLLTLDSFKDKPIESYIQVFMLLIWTIGIIVIFSILTGKE